MKRNSNPLQRAWQELSSPTVDNNATPFGCCNFFDPCDDGLMSLYYAGQLPLLDWMGFNVSQVCLRSMEYLTFVRPARTAQGTKTAGYICDPCDEPHGVEWGSCKLQMEDFGRYGRIGPTRELMKPQFFCKTRPIVRLDGTPVTSEREWDMKFVTDQIINDVALAVVEGDKDTCGQFDGLEHIVHDAYDCKMLDSIVIDWNGNAMSGGAGMTWNGQPIDPTFDIVDVLLAVYTRIRQRISWAPMLRAGNVAVGDMILVMPSDLVDCLLNFYTCWSVCTNSINDSYESRNFRNSLDGGMFGAGFIRLKNFIIPILPYDWGLLKGAHTGDIYFLTGAVGGQRIWEGEHIDGNNALKELGQQNQGYWTTDGGRMLWKIDTANECRTLKGWMHPRMWCGAPFLQARFTDVRCNVPGGFVSPDPDTSWFPMTSFSQAECPV